MIDAASRLHDLPLNILPFLGLAILEPEHYGQHIGDDFLMDHPDLPAPDEPANVLLRSIPAGALDLLDETFSIDLDELFMDLVVLESHRPFAEGRDDPAGVPGIPTFFNRSKEIVVVLPPIVYCSRSNIEEVGQVGNVRSPSAGFIGHACETGLIKGRSALAGMPFRMFCSRHPLSPMMG